MNRVMAQDVISASGSVALLEFLGAAAWTGVVATDALQGIAHGIVPMIAMRTMDMVGVAMLMLVVMVAIGAVHMWLLVHRCRYSGIKLPGIISPLVEMCTPRPSIRPVFSSPSSR
ncbi:hypothetical protein STUTZSP0542_06080 [Stutzerimonas marianensis]